MPSFNAMIARWQAMQVELPQYRKIIQAGIQKTATLSQATNCSTCIYIIYL